MYQNEIFQQKRLKLFLNDKMMHFTFDTSKPWIAKPIKKMSTNSVDAGMTLSNVLHHWLLNPGFYTI